jgi:hypothetical protein
MEVVHINGLELAFEEAIPDTRLILIPNCGQMSNLEQPERFIRRYASLCHHSHA